MVNFISTSIPGMPLSTPQSSGRGLLEDIKQDQQTTDQGPNWAHSLCTAYEVGMVFIPLNVWKELIIFHAIWKLNEIQMAVSINEVLLAHNHGHLFTNCLWLTAVCLKRQKWVVVTEATWPTKPGMFTIQTFTVCQSWCRSSYSLLKTLQRLSTVSREKSTTFKRAHRRFLVDTWHTGQSHVTWPLTASSPPRHSPSRHCLLLTPPNAKLLTPPEPSAQSFLLEGPTPLPGQTQL